MAQDALSADEGDFVALEPAIPGCAIAHSEPLVFLIEDAEFGAVMCRERGGRFFQGSKMDVGFWREDDGNPGRARLLEGKTEAGTEADGEQRERDNYFPEDCFESWSPPAERQEEKQQPKRTRCEQCAFI